MSITDNDVELRNEFDDAKEEYQGDTPQKFIKRSQVRAVMWDKSLGKCWYCGMILNPFRDFSVDHVIPISRGGGEDYDNLVPCCRRCNRLKSSQPLELLRSSLAKRTINWPSFTDEQMDWLKSRGLEIPMPDVPSFKFWFELNHACDICIGDFDKGLRT